MKKLYLRLFYLLIFISLAIFIQGYLIFQSLDYKIEKTIQTGWFPPSLEYYSSPKKIKDHEFYSIEKLKEELYLRNYIQQNSIRKLKPGEFISLKALECKSLKTNSNGDCIIWMNKDFPHTKNMMEYQKKKIKLYQGSPFNLVSFILLDPLLLAQREGESLHFRKRFKLTEVPYLCLQSITTSEDENFILHKGVSLTGIARAFIQNILKGKITQGGSTITQQLIKNRFLNAEKSFKRKWIEILMSLVLERKLTKDQILELYLNTIYMGGTGSYSLYGFASASQYYFNKPLNRMNLSECALLTALLPSPGRLNPFSFPKRAKSKRNIILKKMYKQNTIFLEDLNQALKKSLPKKRTSLQSHKASYFVHAVHKELQTLGIDWGDDLKVYTTMNMKAHHHARKSLKQTLSRLEKKKDKKPLEGALISIDLETNKVRALVGGRDFIHSPFNRAIEAQRPIGSLVKPLTYLSALVHTDINPLTLVQDEPLTIKKWSPNNYNNKYFGTVPLYFALKESLNTASVRVGLDVGLKNIILTFEKLGLTSPIEPLPSLTLGSVELSPLEIVQMYSTIARMGSYMKLSFIDRIESFDGKILYQSIRTPQQVFPEEKVAVLIGMMKQVIESGTARWIKPFWPYSTAGKTGTSNQERDSWFIGFTPQKLTGVWIGYDDNTPHELTGSAGALVTWLQFMRNFDLPFYDFNWPANVEIKSVTLPTIIKSKTSNERQFFKLQTTSTEESPQAAELIFESSSNKKWYQFF